MRRSPPKVRKNKRSSRALEPTTAQDASQTILEAMVSGGAERDIVLHDLRYLTDHIGARPAGTCESARTSEFLMAAVKRLGFVPEIQAFVTRLPWYRRAEVRTASGHLVPCVPISASPSTCVTGDVQALPLESDGEFPDGAIALAAFQPGQEEGAIATAVRHAAKGLLLWRKDSPELPSLAISRDELPLPCLTIRAADAVRFLVPPVDRVTITVACESAERSIENVMVEAGSGRPTLVFLANYDSRSGCPGAYRNASGVAALLALLARLRAWRRHRIVVGFLGGEEVGGLGSRHCRDVFEAIEIVWGLAGVVYVSGLGRAEIAVISNGAAGSRALAARADDCRRREGFPAGAVSGVAPPPGVWDCPVVAIGGPYISAEQTSGDRPGLLRAGHITRAVNILHRLARCV